MVILVLSVVGLSLAGCQTVHEVTVDAISDPAAVHGEAYRLNISRAHGAPVDPVLHEKLSDYIRAALATRGYYEAQGGVVPAVEIEVSYGVGPDQLRFRYKPRDMLAIDLWGKLPPKGGAVPIRVHEKFLKVTARSVPRTSGGRAVERGQEIWSVNITLEDESPELGPYVAALTTAFLDYVGRDAEEEERIKIKETHAQRAVEGLKK